jgi:hypothetical protein
MDRYIPRAMLEKAWAGLDYQRFFFRGFFVPPRLHFQLKPEQGTEFQGGPVSFEREPAVLDFVALVDHEEELGSGLVFPLQPAVHAYGVGVVVVLKQVGNEEIGTEVDGCLAFRHPEFHFLGVAPIDLGDRVFESKEKFLPEPEVQAAFVSAPW